MTLGMTGAAGGPVLRPVGRLRTPFRTLADCPRNPRRVDPAPLCHAEVLPEFAAGLRGLEGFSHLILLSWLGPPEGLAPEPRLVFRPPFDGEERGVFATRAPFRPNPIGVSVVAFEGFETEARLRVRYLDLLDGTLLLDIKPYLPTIDAAPDAAMGWLAPHAAAR